MNGLLKPFFDIAPDIFFRIELGLLCQIADFDIGLWPSLTQDVGIDTGHDLEQGGFTCTVKPEDTNLGTREKG